MGLKRIIYIISLFSITLMLLNCEKGVVDVTAPVSENTKQAIIQNSERLNTAYPNGMISYWKLDGSLIDELGAYPAIMGPSGSYAEGNISQGLRGGRNCSNRVAARVDGFPNLESFTVEAWIKPACPPYSWQGSLSVAKWANGYGGPGFILFAIPAPYQSSTYNFIFALQDEDKKYQSLISPLITYSCNDWYHITAIRDKENELLLYVNGEQMANAIDTIGSITNTQPLTFHGGLQSRCDWGMSEITLDEVAIYNRCLTPVEIQQHYQNGLNGLGYEVQTVEATVDITPDRLNLKSKGKWITAYIELPEGYDVTSIDIGTVALEGTIPAETHPTEIGDFDNDNIPDLMIKFDRKALIEYMDGTTGEMTLNVYGELNDGVLFEGGDNINYR